MRNGALPTDAVFSCHRMKLVRFNSPEVANSIASAGALACWGSRRVVITFASLSSLLLAVALGVFISVRAAVWIGIPVFLALNAYYFWRASSPRLNWVIAASGERLYVRLFAKRRKNKGDSDEPDVMVLEASEIASISARTIEVFVYGPKPKILEWLVIEPAEAVAQAVSSHIRPLQLGMPYLPNACSLAPVDLEKQVFVGNQQGPLSIEWKYCRPALPAFLKQMAQKCPSMVFARESRSELDLNGLWHGVRWEWKKPDAQQRHLFAQAMRLGFGDECVFRLSLHNNLSRRQAATWLAEIAREESDTDTDPLETPVLGNGRMPEG